MQIRKPALLVTGIILALLTAFVVVTPAAATTPNPLVEVCKPKTGGGWQWAVNHNTPPNFLYQGPSTYNVTIKNAWCNANAPTPTPTASPTVYLVNKTQLFPVTICHHTPGNDVTLTFQNWQSYSGHLGNPHNQRTYDTIGACYVPTATPTASAQPTASPTNQPSPTVVGTGSPEPTSTPSETVEPTATPTVEPTVTPSPTDNPPAARTDLSDGRSDGHTESLGCLKPEDKCYTIPQGGGTVGNLTLPETGGGISPSGAYASMIVAVIGWIMKLWAKKLAK